MFGLLAPFLTVPKRLLVIGDSLADYSGGFGLAEKLGPDYAVVTHAVPGYDFTDWILRLDEAFVSDFTPEVVLVPLGTNDGYRFSGEQFTANVARFHADLRLRSEALVVYFLMPRTAEVVLAGNIERNNLLLAQEYPTDFTGLLDLDAVFQQAPELPALYPLEDPIHPTTVGYELIAGEILRFLYAR